MADTREKTKIAFTADGVDYTLEYTPLSVRKMGDDGFDFTNMEKNIINVPYELFRGTFIAHHNYVPVAKRDELYELLVNDNEDGDNLIATLADMLKDEIEYIVSKPKGNVSWAKVQ